MLTEKNISINFTHTINVSVLLSLTFLFIFFLWSIIFIIDFSYCYKLLKILKFASKLNWYWNFMFIFIFIKIYTHLALGASIKQYTSWSNVNFIINDVLIHLNAHLVISRTQMLFRYILSSVCLRLSPFSQLSFMQYIRLYVFIYLLDDCENMCSLADYFLNCH